MMKIRRFLLLPVLSVLLYFLSPAPLMGAWGSSLLSRTQKNFQNLRKSASQLLHNPYVQAGMGIGVATATRWALTSHAQNTARHRSNFFAGQLYRPFNSYDHPTTSSFPQKSQSGTIGTGYIINQSSQTIEHPAQSDENDKILNDVLIAFDASQHQPSKQPLIAPETTILTPHNTHISQQLPQPPTTPNSFVGMTPEDHDAIQNITRVLNDYQISQPQEHHKKAEDNDDLRLNTALNNSQSRENTLRAFFEQLKKRVCPYCGNAPGRPTVLEKLKLKTAKTVNRYTPNWLLPAPLRQTLDNATNLLSNTGCALNRQRIVEHVEIYLQQLTNSTTNSHSNEDSGRIYRWFVSNKNVNTDEQKLYDNYVATYNHGLEKIQEIQRSETPPKLCGDDIINIMNHLTIKSCIQRQSPLSQSTFVLTCGKKLAQALFIDSGLMKDASRKFMGITLISGSTHFTGYKNITHFRLEKNLNFLCGKRELLGAVLHPESPSLPCIIYLKLEDDSVSEDFFSHALGFLQSQIRRTASLKALVNCALTFSGYNRMKTNDDADCAKEHMMEKLKKIINDEASLKSLPKYIKDIVPKIETLKNEKSCDGTIACATHAWLQSLFDASERELLHIKHGLEVSFDLNTIGHEKPFEKLL